MIEKILILLVFISKPLQIEYYDSTVHACRSTVYRLLFTVYSP